MDNSYDLDTPCYCIDYEEMEHNYNAMEAAFLKHWGKNFCMGYSLKTNNFPWLLRYMLKKGAYAEVVSSDEYILAEKLGFNGDRIIYNGPYKGRGMTDYALKNKSIVNIDSIYELEQLDSADSEKPIKVGIRVNFDFKSRCPGEVGEGDDPSRFGICVENGRLKTAVELCRKKGVSIVGIHMHQALKKRSTEAFRVLARAAGRIILDHDLVDTVEYIDMGGGFFGGRGIEGKPTFDDYARAIAEELLPIVNTEKTRLILEPGSALIASAVSYYTKVVSTKDVRNHRLVTVDGTGLHINPLFVKRQPMYKIHSDNNNYREKQIICGSTCLESDRIMELRESPELFGGDLIEIKKCGAYSISFNSSFIIMPPTIYLKRESKYLKIREARSPEVLF